jgi:hypothetical protein
VLRDVSTPDDGLYSVRDPMETRLSYVRWQMDNILSDPAIKVSILGKGALTLPSDWARACSLCPFVEAHLVGLLVPCGWCLEH